MDIGSPFRRVVIDTKVTQGGMSVGNPRRIVVGIRSLCDGIRHKHSQNQPAGLACSMVSINHGCALCETATCSHLVSQMPFHFIVRCFDLSIRSFVSSFASIRGYAKPYSDHVLAYRGGCLNTLCLR